MSLGPLKSLEGDRRQVRALAYFPGLSALPWHEPEAFAWLGKLEAEVAVIRTELEASLASSSWIGNDCEDFDEHGWTQISLVSYGLEHQEASSLFPRTMALLKSLKVPFGPREVLVVRQEGNTGLPRHSDQRNYM